ncbi:MAG TPA: CHAT domain-containing protein, partial [Puia sp.]|nr:CHAT domain-containing protein [Puia sp.]
MRPVIFILFLFFAHAVYAQPFPCPQKDSLWNRIAYLPHSAMSMKDQLDELLQYEKYSKACFFDKDSLYTFLQVNISIDYFRMGDFVPAIQYVRKAINQVYANFDRPEINKKGLAKIYYYLSIYYDSLKLISQKNEAIDSCIANEVKLDRGYHFTSLVLTNRVRDLYNTGDYHLCAEYADFGESLIHRYYKFSDSMDYIIYFIYSKANALFSLKRFADAEQYLQSKKLEFAKEKNKIYVSGIYSMLGHLHKAKAEYETAIVYFQKAYQADLQTSDRTTAFEVLNQIGMIYAENIVQPGKALSYYFQALQYVTASDSFPILGNIANIYVRKKSFDSAFYYFHRAFSSIKPGMDETGLIPKLKDYFNEHTAKDIVKLVLDKGDALLSLYQENHSKKSLLAALNVYKSGDRLLDKIKADQSEMMSQLFWQTDIRSLYEHAIKTCYLMNSPTEAFYFFEKSRASLLYNQLNKQNRSRNEDILKTAQLKRKKLQLERELEMTSGSSNQYVEIQKRLVANRQSLDRLGQMMKLENPLFYQASFDTSQISISDTRKQLLKDHQAILELFEGDSATYALLISTDKATLKQINKRDWDSSTRRFTTYISDPVLLNGNQPEFIRSAQHLYQLIFEGIDLPKGRIIISPDGPSFPFEALVISGNAEEPVYFLYDHATSYAYSARYLLTDFIRNETLSSGSFLGVAPIRYPSKGSLSGLPGSDQSVNRIGSYFSNPQLLIADSATKVNFMRAFSSFRIIQLYTHSSDSSERHEPVIYFSDSSLFLSELIPERKPLTRLIVLSACETGNGTLFEGEGVFSFNRGFAALGIPAALTNLWAVENTSTYRLTELFYQYLTQALPTDIALQQAKIAFIRSSPKQKTLPYYWAGTILAGKTEILVAKNGTGWIYALLFAVATLAVLLIWRRRSSRKNNFE